MIDASEEMAAQLRLCRNYELVSSFELEESQARRQRGRERNDQAQLEELTRLPL